MTLPRWRVVDQCTISQQLNESSAFWQLLDPSRDYLKNNPQPPWNTTWQPRTERTHFQSESDCVVGNHEDRAAMSSESGHGSDTIALLQVLGRLLWSVSNGQGCKSRRASAVQRQRKWTWKRYHSFASSAGASALECVKWLGLHVKTHCSEMPLTCNVIS